MTLKVSVIYTTVIVPVTIEILRKEVDMAKLDYYVGTIYREDKNHVREILGISTHMTARLVRRRGMLDVFVNTDEWVRHVHAQTKAQVNFWMLALMFIMAVFALCLTIFKPKGG